VHNRGQNGEIKNQKSSKIICAAVTGGDTDGEALAKRGEKKNQPRVKREMPNLQKKNQGEDLGERGGTEGGS